MAGALSAYLLMLRVVGRHVAESAAKDALLERLREELGDANVKRAQVEERCNQLKTAIESEKENSAQMVKQIKELNDYALENIKAQLAHITEENLKLRGEELKNSNVEQLGHILAPLREQMRKMEESVRNVDISSAQHKVSIEKSIENLATQAVAVGKHADELARALKNNSKLVESISIVNRDETDGIYPLNGNTGWTVDNYGPVWIPKRGESIALTPENIAIYERPIVAYEGNTLDVKDDKIFINGQECDSYTFKMDYYWMMGDNRHNSADSRCWGFVPEDHIVGKALFVWLSLDKDRGWFDGKIRWNRLFRSVNSFD